jgi:serine/threonine protein kinase
MDQVLSTDGAPEWDCPTGGELPGGTRAWERLGVGPRCETWLVWSQRPWCAAVLKLPRPHQQRHPRAIRALGREAAALEGAVHPALPRLLLDGRCAPLPYLLEEYADGVGLAGDLATGGPIRGAEAALLGAGILAGLAALHDRGIAHVNVTPRAVVLRDGRPVLVGLGSARRIGAPQPVGRPIGTPGYAAPELAAGAPIAAGADVYGVGTVLHEALTGRPVFDPEVPARLRRVLRPLPSEVQGRSTARAVMAMLEPDPACRPTVPEALSALACAAPPQARPWPEWADADLGATAARPAGGPPPTGAALASRARPAVSVGRHLTSV